MGRALRARTRGTPSHSQTLAVPTPRIFPRHRLSREGTPYTTPCIPRVQRGNAGSKHPDPHQTPTPLDEAMTRGAAFPHKAREFSPSGYRPPFEQAAYKEAPRGFASSRGMLKSRVACKTGATHRRTPRWGTAPRINALSLRLSGRPADRPTPARARTTYAPRAREWTDGAALNPREPEAHF